MLQDPNVLLVFIYMFDFAFYAATSVAKRGTVGDTPLKRVGPPNITSSGLTMS